MKYFFHQPVLLAEAGEYLLTNRNGFYVDCTIGGAGHSEHFLRNISKDAFLIGIDADCEALEYARQRLNEYPNKYLRQAFYNELEVVLYEIGKFPVDGVFYDLGISSFQINESRRGFSFQTDGPLDMRFNQHQTLTAAQILNTYPKETLEKIIREFGEERHWRAIVRKIIWHRTANEFRTTGDLAAVVKGVVGERHLKKTLARVFQAIRIEVNQELARVEQSLSGALKLLKKGGRLVVMSYHSLEDRIVKSFMRSNSLRCDCPPEFPTCVCNKVPELKLIQPKGLVPDPEEVKDNSRARSARLRIAEKIQPFQGI